MDNQPKTQPSQPPISILIAEDHALFSQGVKIMLENTGRFHPVLLAPNGKQAVLLARQHHPKVILMDIQMPEVNGLYAARLIKASHPEIKIIMLTSFTDANTVHIALSGGVEAYCSKDVAMEKLLSVIQMVLDGSVYLDPAVANHVIKNHSGQCEQHPVAKPANPPISQTPEAPATKPDVITKLDIPAATPIRTDVLTARELELLSLIADNRTNEEIADILKIGSAWVDGYIKDIINKLAVNNEVEAVRRALEDGAIKTARLFEQDQLD